MDVTTLKLGRLPVDHSRLAKVARAELYIDAPKLIEASQAPAAINWFRPPAWLGSVCAPDADPLGNDRKGDCVRAGIAHQLNRIFQLTGSTRRIGAAEVLADYDRATGGVDGGEVILDVLHEGMTVGLFGERIAAVARVDAKDNDAVALAAFCGGGVYGGYALPALAQEQIGRGEDWTIPPGGFPEGDRPGQWGLHAMDTAEVSPGLDIHETWGMRQAATPNWRATCCDELYLVLWERWARADGRVPSGFAYEQLLADVRARGGV